ncbi:4Fe-4S binding protein [Ferrimonas lipolytica]|uniref:4Fe-4S binding protein n=1 Tax=Ferrimonas lipolytica TaxID=2724191 RepID=A0A6H1UIG5_9GAMM|nr:4Fe-4S binding protein [Ferrimonas lipolytica]QIZ78006.1 4Fe-4S binding protein [Ferrimonas lipolytica]
MSQNSITLDPISADALQQTTLLANLIPATVSFQTAGNLLLVGPEDRIRIAAAKLPQMASRTLLISEAISDQSDAHLEQVMAAAEATESLPCFHAEHLQIRGFLGQFQVAIVQPQQQQPIALAKEAINLPHFDLILDLGNEASITLELLPAGYFHVGDNQTKLVDALAQLPELVGKFDKPRYVQVNQDVCAHYSSGIAGCQRCLSVCPADAIQSENNQISIDPFLCHGAGSCASACPTGAIQYDQPTAPILRDYMQRLLARYNELSEQQPVVLFHDGMGGTELLQQLQQLPAGVVPVELEEIGVAGAELWLASLAWGARQVLVLTHEQTPETLATLVTSEYSSVAKLLLASGVDAQRLQIIDAAELAKIDELVAVSATLEVLPVAAFGTELPKRDTFYNALDHLNGCHLGTTDTIAVANVPYGQVVLDTDKCTLCMSCAALCPAMALQDGGDTPALKFTEQNCVQCGLCQQACPEQALSLAAQFNLDRDSRQQQQVLKEEDPFECITCGKAFATKAVVEKMTTALAGHSAFAGDAIQRLKMCEDCRVKDMFGTILDDPEQQLRV